MIKIIDSRGNKSLTLGFVTIAFIAGTAGFIWSFIHGNPPDLTGYGTFVFGSMIPWLAREYTEKVGKENDNS